MANTVQCRNCQNYSSQADECAVWFEATRHANENNHRVSVLFQEIGGMVDADSERICRHFSGDYPFMIGE